jgi:hypothetical protein
VERIPIAFGVDGDGRHAQLAAGADDANGDLAAIGDQNLLQNTLFYWRGGVDAGGRR